MIKYTIVIVQPAVAGKSYACPFLIDSKFRVMKEDEVPHLYSWYSCVIFSFDAYLCKKKLRCV